MNPNSVGLEGPWESGVLRLLSVQMSPWPRAVDSRYPWFILASVQGNQRPILVLELIAAYAIVPVLGPIASLLLPLFLCEQQLKGESRPWENLETGCMQRVPKICVHILRKEKLC